MGSLPTRKKIQMKHITNFAATTAEGPEGEPWPRPPRRCEEDVSAHKRDEQ